ncbi:hypothetical protein GCM10008090_34710 [Arenicella chitinivorans]|uniref:Uncharacterized protein n=1 Tax=Arenicella chitinivorans TaxID=1329800 RepID=A0A918S409_9GAMM|nr:hypothetical protein [Arenicella chitinivorans]GHA21849.1 hypothetical protein GCM10008090_34710 [Arenicella chitinivorans]
MNIPSFPTDNLYKFLAISGTLIVISILAFGYQTLYELETKMAVNKGDIAIIDQTIERIKNKEKVSDEELEKIYSLSLDSLRISTINNELALVNQKFFARTTGGMILGLILMLVGFSLWYSRVQVYQDIVLAKKISSKPDDT